MKSEETQIAAIYNVFNPSIPATQRFYVDCNESRGGSDLVRTITRKLEIAENVNLHYLFTGPIGCGKSSELLHLVNNLEKETVFFPIYIDFNEYLDIFDTSLEDIFLGMISSIAARCKDKLGIKVKAEFYSLIKKIALSLEDFLPKDDVESLPYIASLDIKSLRQNPNLRQQIRDVIEKNDKKSLFDELNTFITEIEFRLKQETKYTKLVIIADSLSRIQRFRTGENEYKDELDSQVKLFLDKAEQLTGIVTNVIYDVPVSLYRSYYGNTLSQIYTGFVALPMVKIHRRGNFDIVFMLGRQELIEIVSRRLRSIGTSIDKVFEPDALDYLLKYSGGNIRSLILLVQEALVEIDKLPIDFEAAQKSIKGVARAFASSIREDYWKKLAALEFSANQQIENNGDGDFMRMIEQLVIMEHIGDERDDDEIWYSVNPVVRKTTKFKAALISDNSVAHHSKLEYFLKHDFENKGNISCSVFLSHNSKDKPFVNKLAARLVKSGIKIWLDDRELNIGDSLIQKIGDAIEETDYFAVVLSNNSINSTWVQKELQEALSKELNQKKKVVLPIIIEEVTIPGFLRDKLYADFTSEEKFEESFQRLLRSLQS